MKERRFFIICGSTLKRRAIHYLTYITMPMTGMGNSVLAMQSLLVLPYAQRYSIRIQRGSCREEGYYYVTAYMNGRRRNPYDLATQVS